MKKITLLIPCYNEEKGIGFVLDNIPRNRLKQMGYSIEPIVIDNNSSDKTSEVVRNRGVRIIEEKRQGKGCAIVKGFNSVSGDTDLVVMIDGDNTYDIQELPRLIEPLVNGFGEVVVGSRLHGKITDDSMPTLNRWGNWFFTFLARVGYTTNVTDVCSGFFAWKRHVVDNLKSNIESDSFSVEMEMIVKMAKMKYACYSVPISYNNREGTSSLRPFSDGMMIIGTWAKYLFWSLKKPD